MDRPEEIMMHILTQTEQNIQYVDNYENLKREEALLDN